jgi:hypothetical protein
MTPLHDWPAPVAGVDYLSRGVPQSQEVRFGYYDLKYTLITAFRDRFTRANAAYHPILSIQRLSNGTGKPSP